MLAEGYIVSSCKFDKLSIIGEYYLLIFVVINILLAKIRHLSDKYKNIARIFIHFFTIKTPLSRTVGERNRCN